MDERPLAEAAFDGLDDVEGPADLWPSVASRIRGARERVGLQETDVAERLGISHSEYWDIEFHDDEAFTSFSVTHLVRLAEILEEPLLALLFGPEYRAPGSQTSYATIARRLSDLAASRQQTVDELSEQVGWELAPSLANPELFGELSLAGLHDVCRAIDVDWTTALPMPSRPTEKP